MIAVASQEEKKEKTASLCMRLFPCLTSDDRLRHLSNHVMPNKTKRLWRVVVPLPKSQKCHPQRDSDIFYHQRNTVNFINNVILTRVPFRRTQPPWISHKRRQRKCLFFLATPSTRSVDKGGYCHVCTLKTCAIVKVCPPPSEPYGGLLGLPERHNQ